MTLTNYCGYLDLSDIHHALGLCLKLLTKVQPSMVTSPDTKTGLIPHPEPDQLPQALLKQLEGIENGYEMIEPERSEARQERAPVPTRKGEQSDAKGMTIGTELKDKEMEKQEEEDDDDESSTLIDAKDKDSDDDSGTVQSLDRLSSQPTKFSENNPPPTRLRRPTSLSSRQDSSSLLDESMDSPEQAKTVDRKPPNPSISSMGNSESDKDGPPMFLMQACVQCFQTFFAKLITKKILPNADIVKTCMTKLQVGDVVASPVKAPSENGQEEPEDASDKDNDQAEEGEIKKRNSWEELPWKPKSDKMEEVRTRTDSALTSDEAARQYLGEQIESCPLCLISFCVPGPLGCLWI